jgi:hypothetical protein
VPFTKEQLEASVAGLAVERYRWKTIRGWMKR